MSLESPPPPPRLLPPPPPPVAPVAIDGVDIAVEAGDVYCYAMSHRPLVRSITITNRSVDPSVEELVVAVAVEALTAEPIVHPVAIAVPCPAVGDSVTITTARLAPNPRALALLDEAVTANLVVAVESGGRQVGLDRQQLTVLAYNQWMHRRDAYDSYAAFVLPHHPQVATVLDRARTLLGERTGHSGTDGSQSVARGDVERVHQIAEALYDALAEQRFAYSDPPASFEGYGQKIRTPDVVFAERACTCLDSTVLYASCLAAAGLDPYLVLVRGHAFAGYRTGVVRSGDSAWTQELELRSVLDNANEITALFSSGAVVGVETTAFTASDRARSFREAVAATAGYLGADAGTIEGVVNVRRARASGVTAIAARRRDGDVVELVVDRADMAPLAEQGPGPEAGGAASAEVDVAERRRREAFEAPARVRSWLNALLDLSYANPLLNLRDGKGAFRFELTGGQLAQLEDRLMSSDQGIELLPASKAPNQLLDADDPIAAAAADFAANSRLYWPDLRTVEPRIAAVRKQLAVEHPDLPPARASVQAEALVGEEIAATLDKRVGAVKRRAREIETQVGSNNLFVTIGSLAFTEPTAGRRGARSEPSIAPLFLVPVRLTGSAATAYRITVDPAADVVPNYCLLEKLRQVFDVTLSELEQPELDVSGIDVDRMLGSIRQSLAAARITDAVVEETAYLAVLNFSTFRLWKDMRDHWQDFMGNAVVRHLVETPFQSFADPQEQAPIAGGADLLLPVETDESQLEAVRWAVSGRSFVLEGPPGTGKSQTIANVLAAAIAARKRVLFVAEKQVALSVVKKRLEKVGLAPFCLDLHDKGSKPEQIRQQLRSSLDFAGQDVEHQWDELSARHHADEAALEAYRGALHTANRAGYSLWSAVQDRIELGPGESFAVDQAFLDRSDEWLPAVRDALLSLPEVIGAVGQLDSHPWSLAGRGDFDGIDLAALGALLHELDAVSGVIVAQGTTAAPALAVLTGPPAFAQLAAAIEASIELAAVDPSLLHEIVTPAWSQYRDQFLQRVLALQTEQAQVREVFIDAVHSAELGPVIAAGTEAATAGLFSRGKKEKAFQVLVAPFLRHPTELEPAQLTGLLQRAALARTSSAELDRMLAVLPGGSSLGRVDLLSPDDIGRVHTFLTAAPLHAAALDGPVGRALRSAQAAGWRPDREAADVLRAAGQAWTRFAQLLATTDRSAARWLHGRSFVQAWQETGPEWTADAPRFLRLQRWTEAVAAVDPLVRAGLGGAADGILRGEVPVDDGYERFRRGVVEAALAERLDAGRLGTFDGLAHDRRVHAYTERDRQRRTLMRTVIPHRLVTARPFKPATRIGEYGALERELSKSARRLGVRKLMERYGEILPNLTPCFLMSPDSVARFLPPQSVHFDLVVFDEASQIEVAEAIGAMGRADAVLVVGDSRQMPPSKFGGTTTIGLGDDEIESDDPTFEDLESILSECVESNMPRLWLQCHYRSRHEGLITFSNHAFYEGRLTTFPSPHDGTVTPISWRYVDGEFLRSGTGEDLRTNPVEAAAVVEEIRRRFADPATAGQSICVVTLNIQQSNLITRLLEQTGDPMIRDLLEDDGDNGLIVRNLESVQGDERDVVIFSTGFAPPITRTPDGEVRRGRLPLNFGPLNRKGGERRLNVAVTRARSEVLVFSSFQPEEMVLADEPSRGLELLKQYLTIARDGAGRVVDLAVRAPSVPDRYREEIAEALRARGLRVRENLGLSKFRIDLAVGAADRTDWPVAVLLDGPAWAERSTVYDREVLPPSVLEMMGWSRVLRVWLPSWLQEPERVLDDLVASVDAAVAPPSTENPPTAPVVVELAADPIVPVTRNVFAAPPSSGLESVFVAAPATIVGERSALDRIGEADADEQIRRAIADVIELEAPIHLDRLGKLVANRFGLGTVRQARIDDIASLVPLDHQVHTQFGTFVWTATRRPSEWRGYRRTPAGADRRIEHVAPEEIVNAMADLVRMGHAMETEELLRHVADVFGLTRVSANLRTHLTAVLQGGVAAGRLALEGTVVSPMP